VKYFCELFQTTQDDILVILGDACINYYLNERDGLIKRYLDTLPITLFCVHGNHEERPVNISSYKEVEWHGGKVYMEDGHPGILFAKDGEIYDLNGKRAIVIGGAYSVDKWIRLARGFKWYENEQPSEEIKQAVEDKLKQVGWQVDVMLSHTCPLKYEPSEVFLPWVDQSEVNRSTEIWLGEIEECLNYQRWYCGHFHIDKLVDKLRFMFNDFEVLD